MFYGFEELREKAKENLSHWLGTASYGEKEIIRYADGYQCNDWNSSLDFKTSDINTVLDFLFPA